MVIAEFGCLSCSRVGAVQNSEVGVIGDLRVILNASVSGVRILDQGKSDISIEGIPVVGNHIEDELTTSKSELSSVTCLRASVVNVSIVHSQSVGWAEVRTALIRYCVVPGLAGRKSE